MSITDVGLPVGVITVMDNLNSINAVATLIIAISAAVTVFLTRALVRENRLLRKAGTEPEIVAYLAIHPLYQTFLNFVLANVGRGPAQNVRFKLAANSEDLEARDVALRNSVDRKPISFLPQGENMCVYFGNTVDVLKEPRLSPFDVFIDYEDMKGRKHRRTCRLDVAQFVGFSLLGDPPEKEVANSLKKIEGHLKGFAKPIDDMGNIPNLLDALVWKEPRGTLEVLREIFRVLPVGPMSADWRDEISGVGTALNAKSTATELSEEAEAILKAAVAGNGIVMHRRYMGGQAIQAGHETLMKDQDSRTAARWVGGLEDLQRRRYIKDRGHKGELFEVTREGYDAADKLSGA